MQRYLDGLEGFLVDDFLDCLEDFIDCLDDFVDGFDGLDGQQQ